jgi:pimeloyl-ACP methyl ester carboxylesterase
MKKVLLGFTILIFLFASDVQAENVDGHWSGVAHTDAEQTHLALTIKQSGNEFSAWMSLADIGVSDWPAQQVERIDNTLKVIFSSDSGLQEMLLELNEQSMSGTWHESRFKDAAIVELTKVVREFPVTEQRIFINGPAGKLGASLIMPVCKPSCPGVVFLHGSGPQRRDSNRFAALSLAENGIASIIFDKRGVAQSQGDLNNVTFEALAADANAVADFLRQQTGISKVGFFGHSQGGWIAPLAGINWKYTAFVVTSAGPAVSPAREAEWDVVRQLRANQISKQDEEQARQFIQFWHAGIRSGRWSEFEQALNKAKTQVWFKIADLNEFMARPDEIFAHRYHNFMDYDPMPVLRSLSSPLLAILAPNDESIDALETEKILQTLMNKGHDISLKIYPNYDHSMHRMGSANNPLRWPHYPDDYFSVQALFIHKSVNVH